MNGACICGAVRFSGTPRPGRGIGVCHCLRCRTWAGGPNMVIRCAGGITLTEGETLAWYRSSDDGERGFCSRCGSSLFWRVAGEPRDWAVNVHAFGDAHGQTIREHIWIDAKPDFYDFTDPAPRLTGAEANARPA